MTKSSLKQVEGFARWGFWELVEVGIEGVPDGVSGKLIAVWGWSGLMGRHRNRAERVVDKPRPPGCLLDVVVRAVAGYAASNVRIFVSRLRLTCAIAIESITATASPAFSLILVIPRTK